MPKTLHKSVAYLTGSSRRPDAAQIQRSAIEKRARAARFDVVEWFSDDDAVGSIVDRHGLQQAIAAIKSRSAAHLVVASAEILGDMLDRAIVERLVERNGAILLVLDDAGRSPTLARQIEAFERFEHLLFATAMRATHATKKRKRERVGTIPWGYRLSEDGEKLVVDDAERRVRVVVLHMRTRGLKLREIVKELKTMGIRGRGGKPIGTTRVFEMIHGGRTKAEGVADARQGEDNVLRRRT